MTVHQLYEQTMKPLSIAERLHLATLILNDIPPQAARRMFITPGRGDLENSVEFSERGIAADEESAPEQRADAVQDNTKMIDTGQSLGVAHALSIPQRTPPMQALPESHTRWLLITVSTA
jgi:hypothetical protein